MERQDVHVLITATPDHWHTLVNMAAVKAGKDVYGEKPLTLTIDEGRRLVRTVREHQTILQTGSDSGATRGFAWPANWSATGAWANSRKSPSGSRRVCARVRSRRCPSRRD